MRAPAFTGGAGHAPPVPLPGQLARLGRPPPPGGPERRHSRARARRTGDRTAGRGAATGSGGGGSSGSGVDSGTGSGVDSGGGSGGVAVAVNGVDIQGSSPRVPGCAVQLAVTGLSTAGPQQVQVVLTEQTEATADEPSSAGTAVDVTSTTSTGSLVIGPYDLADRFGPLGWTAADNGYHVRVTVDVDGEPIEETDLPHDAILVIGGERYGLSGRARALAHRSVGIPMRPGVSSLNLATAVAALLFSWRSAVLARTGVAPW